MTKEAYKKELESLNKRRREINELYQNQLSDEYHDELTCYIGKYYKYENSYSSEEKWFEYLKVLEILFDSVYDHGDYISFRCIVKRFCQLPDGEIRINMHEEVSSNLLEIEISEDELDTAMNTILQNIY
ncbi:hypothetical protein [Chryseobacterium lathyri]|uniref:hypothetical protein n=1 Tax=Chryseobacterium lathyri TaxID=395933 RepID=UPI001CBDF6E1|nr:hypothetical protein [Chryseobacterium lathyri]